ncbi:MAG: hypothetical protein QXX64_06325 [Nitrososphaera sp.]
MKDQDEPTSDILSTLKGLRFLPDHMVFLSSFTTTITEVLGFVSCSP